jgi:hypothetical protein
LTDFQINQIAFAVRDGIATPEDAKRLVAHFCELIERRKPFPPRLLEHFREAFSAYLSGTKSLEQALGMARKKGRPPADEVIQAKMAAEVMRRRLVGTSHQQALEETAHKYGWAESVISIAWRGHRMSALQLIVVERVNIQPLFTESEKRLLRKIFHDMPKLDYSGKIAD